MFLQFLFFIVFLFSADVFASLLAVHQKLLISVITEGNQTCNLEDVEKCVFSQSVNNMYEGLQDQNSQIFKNAVHGDKSCFRDESHLCITLSAQVSVDQNKHIGLPSLLCPEPYIRLRSLLCQEPYKSFFTRKNVEWVLKDTENILIYKDSPVNYPKLTPIEFFVYTSGLLPLPYLCPKTFSMHRSGEDLCDRQYGMALLQEMLNESECADVGIFYQRKHVGDGSTVDQYVKSSFCNKILNRILKKNNRKRFYISCEENGHRFKTILYDLEKKEAYWFEPVGVQDRGWSYIEKMGFTFFYCSTPLGMLQNYYYRDVYNDASKSMWDKTCFIKSLAFAKALALLMQNKTFLDRFDSVGDRDKAAFVRMAVHGYVPEYFELLSGDVDQEATNELKKKGLQVRERKEILLADLNARWEIFTRCFLKTVESSEKFVIDQEAIADRKATGEGNLQRILKIDFADKSKNDSLKPFFTYMIGGTFFIGFLYLVSLMLQGKLLSMPQ